MEETKLEGNRFLDFLKRNEISLVAITALFLFCTLFYYVNSPYERCIRFLKVDGKNEEHEKNKSQFEDYNILDKITERHRSLSARCMRSTHW